jgi:hypothetical protein
MAAGCLVLPSYEINPFCPNEIFNPIDRKRSQPSVFVCLFVFVVAVG